MRQRISAHFDKSKMAYLLDKPSAKVEYIFLFQCRAAVGTILPVRLQSLPAIGAGTQGRWRRGVADVPHEPGDAKDCERNEANRDQPHEEHTNPSEGGISPAAHHARSTHHAPAVITPPAHPHPCCKQEQESNDADDCYNQPIDFFHFLFPFTNLQSLSTVRAVFPVILRRLIAMRALTAGTNERFQCVDKIIA